MRFNILLVLAFTLQTITSGYYVTDSTLLSSSFLAPTFYLLESLYTWAYTVTTNYMLVLSLKTVTLNAIIFTVKFLLI